MQERQNQFSFLVEQYFKKRGTYPIYMSRREPTTEEELHDLQSTVENTFSSLTGVEILDIQTVDGDFWSGVLLELSGNEFIEVSTDGEPVGRNKCHIVADDIHYDFASSEKSRSRGFNCGTSVYSAASLEALGREFFK